MTFWRALRGLITFVPLALSGMDVISWGQGLLASGIGIASVLLEAWLERSSNSSSDGWETLILLESAAIVVVLASLHLAAAAGFVVLAPYIARRKSAEFGPRTSYVAAALVLFAGWSAGKAWAPSGPEVAEAVAIGCLAWLINRTSSSVPKFLQAPVPAAFAPAPTNTDELYESLRDRYRALRGSYKEMEVESLASRAIATIAEWRFEEDRTPNGLAKTLRELAHLDGIALYTVPDARDGFAIIGASGTAASEVESLPGSLQASPIVIRETAEREIRTAVPGSTARIATVILTDRGRLVGLAALFDTDRAALDAGAATIERLSTFIAAVLRDEADGRRRKERVSQLELMNRFAGRASEGTPRESAQGYCSDLVSELSLDACAIVDLTGMPPKILAAVGDSATDLLRFPAGSDLKGWMGSGAPELVVDDARQDRRCDETLALRRGVGAMAVLPLISSGSLVGALVTWTSKRRGISSVSLGTLRALIPYMLRQVFGGFATSKPGLVDPDTFWHGTQGPGSFVEIDLGRPAGSSAPPELQEARRGLLMAALGRLPQGGLITRRSAGTLLAFLPGYDETAAQRWATGLRPLTDERWDMRIDPRGSSQQTRQFFERMTA